MIRSNGSPTDKFIDAIAEVVAERVLMRLSSHLPADAPTASGWLTLKEGAAYARKNYKEFTAIVRAREIPAYQVSGEAMRGARVKKKDIDEWLESNPY